MKRFFSIIVCGLMVINSAGCASLRPAAHVDAGAGVAPLPAYSGPKARIAITDFEVKAVKATGESGSGLREMLVTALVNSNRFSVAERQAAAELIITIAVTEFEPEASGGRAGVGGGGGAGSGAMGGLLGTALNKAHTAMDINIVDTSSSKVLASGRVKGQASDVAGSVMAGFFGNWALGTGLSSYANTPMEKAIRVCIIEAVRYISQTIPATYYKY